MRSKVVIALALAVGSTVAAHAWEGQRSPQPVPRPAQAQGHAAIRALFDGYVSTKKMPGIVGAFGRGDAPTLFVSAGSISLDPDAAKAGPDTLWRVYSMTKPITAMAAMMLIEDGKLKLDQPLSDIYPEFNQMRVLTSPDTSLESVPATRPITIRMLLTHTAGLSYNISAKGPLLKEYERLGLLPGAINAAVEAQAKLARPKSLQDFARRVAQAPLIAQPGTKWSYSIGLDLTAAVVEKVSGVPFERFVQTRLFDPLKMRSSYWTVPQSEIGRFADNYLIAGTTLTPLDPAKASAFTQSPSFPYGGAGLVSSARDYDRFLHMLVDEGTLDGVRVMKPQTVRLALSNLLPPGVTFQGVGGATGGTQGPPMGYGAGGSVYLADVPGGASKGTYGWGGAAGTIAWVDPVKKIRGTVMVNYFPADRWPVRSDVVKALYADSAQK
ncbi:serine hydrolase domain-containing protein [uncultured Sphingomonas sp.]|uniref:serine hydrolase domain-containing protein n=1 Tax=uncultured Sphingomonas sp. TaxID=158754 RepID=UPI0025DE8EA7|nr:serine hydrolase domain-containing protein [uncultured Sphingomonas sp.]